MGCDCQLIIKENDDDDDEMLSVLNRLSRSVNCGWIGVSSSPLSSLIPSLQPSLFSNALRSGTSRANSKVTAAWRYGSSIIPWDSPSLWGEDLCRQRFLMQYITTYNMVMRLSVDTPLRCLWTNDAVFQYHNAFRQMISKSSGVVGITERIKMWWVTWQAWDRQLDSFSAK